MSTVCRFVGQTWTQTVCAALKPSSFPSIPPAFREAIDSGEVPESMQAGTCSVGPTLAPPPCSCGLICPRAWPGSTGLPSPGFFPTTCSRRERVSGTPLTLPLLWKQEEAPWPGADANETSDKMRDGYCNSYLELWRFVDKYGILSHLFPQDGSLSC